MRPSLLAQVNPDTVEVVTTETSLQPLTQLKPSFYLTTTINLLLGSAGVFSFIYLLWGGIQWITAGGDKDAVEKARKKIIGALIGLIIVFSSYALLYSVRVLFNVNLIQVEIAPLGSASSSAPSDPGPIPGPPPTADLGVAACGSCGGTGCGLLNIVYIGAGGICYRCQSDGWHATGGTSGGGGCVVQDCGTCP